MPGSSTAGRRRLGLAALAGLALAVGGVWGARYVATSHARPAPAALSGAVLELRVPHAKGNIVLDGDMDDPGWLRESARTNAFVGPDGVSPARPYSDARFVWGDGYLYIALYAADEDIHATQSGPDAPVWLDDSFHFVLSDGSTERSFDVSPTGAFADGTRAAGPGGKGSGPFDFRWESGAHVSHELDGTPNQPGDFDEEWVIEMAVPFDALGLRGQKGERVGFAVHRCDTPRSGVRSCGSWGEGDRRGVLVLD